MLLVDDKITLAELKKMSETMLGNLVKAVVDIEKKIMVVDAPFHADQEEYLLEEGSDQNNLWGINLYPDSYGTDQWLVFDSMINMRPSWGNRSRGVDDLRIQKIIRDIVASLVTL